MLETELEKPKKTVRSSSTPTRVRTPSSEAMSRPGGRTPTDTAGSGASARAGGVKTLEKKNKQLNNATKELEEKMKNLRQKTQQRALPKVRHCCPQNE